MITIQQEPYGLQPVNSEHIWTIYDDDYANYTNYKYVIDFYIDPYESGAEKIGRIKLRPNTYGKASFNAKDIIKNYIAPNPRTASGATMDYTALVNGSGFTFTNYLNDDTDYETLRQIANYRIMVGREYLSGGTTTLYISDGYYYPSDYGMTLTPAGNTISFSGANGWENYVSPYSETGYSYTSGYTYQHTTSDGTPVAFGDSNNDAGSYTASPAPSAGDIFYVYSKESGCGGYAVYTLEVGWRVDGTYNTTEGIDGICFSGSDFKTIWLGASPNLLTSDDPTSLTLNSTWADRYKMIRGVSGSNPDLYPYENAYENRDWDIEQGAFLNTFGGIAKNYNISGMDFTTDTTGYIYSRKHHRECPIVLNWISGLNGAYRSTADFLITFSGTGKSITSAQQLTPLSDGTGSFTPANELIQSYIVKDIPTNTDWQGFMLSDGTPPVDAWADGNSMLLLYDLYGGECIDDPVHFLFINRHGGFDTYTFGQKNIRSHSTNISTYAKNGITNTNLQKWGSDMYRNTPYDQTTTTSVEAQSTFVDENDVPIIQDLFMSPYVWRIQRFKDDYYLVPIQITSNSVEEYKNRYNKLYQYDMTFNYNPIRQFNNPL